MKNIFAIIKDNPLFSGIAFSDFEQMLNCLNARTVSYKKGEIILLTGNTMDYVGIILSGSANILREDTAGKETITTDLAVSDIFGEALACAGIYHSPVTITAAEDCAVLCINYRKIITTCSSACVFHTRLIENMLMLIARKNIMLMDKLEIVSKRTTRERLLLYFNKQRGTANKFTIPFNREELANYLCVDRSAMSNELSKMRNEGIIRFDKNTFELV